MSKFEYVLTTDSQSCSCSRLNLLGRNRFSRLQPISISASFAEIMSALSSASLSTAAARRTRGTEPLPEMDETKDGAVMLKESSILLMEEDGMSPTMRCGATFPESSSLRGRDLHLASYLTPKGGTDLWPALRPAPSAPSGYTLCYVERKRACVTSDTVYTPHAHTCSILLVCYQSVAGLLHPASCNNQSIPRCAGHARRRFYERGTYTTQTVLCTPEGLT